MSRIIQKEIQTYNNQGTVGISETPNEQKGLVKPTLTRQIGNK